MEIFRLAVVSRCNIDTTLNFFSLNRFNPSYLLFLLKLGRVARPFKKVFLGHQQKHFELFK